MIIVYNQFVVQSGVLSTGLSYEFRREINLNELRKQLDVDGKRTTDDVIIAQTPMEVAELGQFYFHTVIQDMFQPNELSRRELPTIVVHYCNETNNWVLQQRLPTRIRGEAFLIMELPHIVAINRTTGGVIEFSHYQGGDWMLDIP